MIEVFVSHAYKDKNLVNAFVSNILKLGIGIKNEAIRCISVEGSKIMPGKDWRNTLRSDLKEAKVVLQVITPNYQDSEMCLIEMGASWISDSIVIPIIVEPIRFKDAGVIKEIQQIEKIDDSTSLDRIRDAIISTLPIYKSQVGSDAWSSLKERFLEEAKPYLTQLKSLKEINEDIEKNGFRLADIDDIIAQTIDTLQRVNSMKIVGVARQYYREKNNDNNFSNYLSLLESRFSDANRQFICRRLTIMDLKENFLEHLHKCFLNAAKSSNKCRFELGIVDDLEMKFTYYVMGDEIAVINIYYKDDETRLVDCPQGLITKNKEIIKMFKQHFDRVWDRESRNGAIIESLEEFEKKIPFDERIINSQKNISKYTKRLPNNSSRTAWAVAELQQLEARLKGLIDYSLKLKNKIDNGKLLNVISLFVKLLEKNDTYETISFFEFWQFITSDSVKEFIDANDKALSQGANIYRIYLIDSGRIKDSEYITRNSKILQEHLELIKRYKNEGNYKFKLEFVNAEDYLEYRKEYRNFAIWQTKTEKVFFNPKYDESNEIHPMPFETQIIFIDKTIRPMDFHTNYKENQYSFDGATIVFRNIKEKVRSLSDLTKEQEGFLEKSSINKNDWHYFFV